MSCASRWGRSRSPWRASGATAPASVIAALFGSPNAISPQTDTANLRLQQFDNVYSASVFKVLEVAGKFSAFRPSVVVVRTTDRAFSKASDLLIEDKNLNHISYVDYLCQIHGEIQRKSAAS